MAETAPVTAAITTSPQPDEKSVAMRVPSSVRDSRPARVSVNRASAVELARVKGMSRRVAEEIVKRRPYASIDELIDVRGIGPKLLARFRPYLSL